MKSKAPRAQLNRQILDEAAAWFVEFRTESIDSGARERFDQWLRQSPEHIRAYLEIAQTYVDLPGRSSPAALDAQALAAYGRSDGNVISLAAHTTPAHAPIAQKRIDRRRFIGIALAASIALVCGALYALSARITGYSTYSTQIGERRSFTLADGSTIDLNARSEIRVRLQKSRRDVELIDGQALFEVAKDKARPFIVRSGDTVVRAVGTQFDVYHQTNGTTVTVIEGRVAVSDAPANPAAAATPGAPADAATSDRDRMVLVSAGEQLTVSNHAISHPQHADVAVVTAWVQHRMVFDASRLSDVVDDFNRYNFRQIIVEDRALDDFHVSGVYSSTDPASLLRFLREEAGVEVIETDRDVRIRRKR